MIFTVVIMLAASFVAARVFCRPVDRASLQAALSGIKKEALAASVTMLAAMMPAVRCAGFLYDTDSSLSVRLIFGAEAVICAAMVLWIGKWERRIRDQWQSRLLHSVIAGGMV